MNNTSELKIIRTDGLYYWVENDPRAHISQEAIAELEKTIPNYFEDTCPECGNRENINGCRCVQNHRYCKCECKWRWVVNLRKATIEVRIENHGHTFRRE